MCVFMRLRERERMREGRKERDRVAKKGRQCGNNCLLGG